MHCFADGLHFVVRNLRKGDVKAMLRRIKLGKGPFSKGGGLLGSSNEAFRAQGNAVDFAEFRDFMLLTSARDLRDVFEVSNEAHPRWGETIGIARRRRFSFWD